jgi:D-tyrosyl-tRNA(Tyr) deacylase
MRAVVQRVSRARVVVDGAVVGEIERGLLVYLGVGRDDVEDDLRSMIEKVAGLRVFEDEAGKMHRSLEDERGAALVVSQFTLYGDARRGRRPSFDQAMPPALAAVMYQRFVEGLRARAIVVQTGVFGAAMSVECAVDGPVTILLDSKKIF